MKFQTNRRGRPRKQNVDPDTQFKKNVFDFIIDVASELIHERFNENYQNGVF